MGLFGWWFLLTGDILRWFTLPKLLILFLLKHLRNRIEYRNLCTLICKSLHCLSIWVNLDKKGRLTVFLQRYGNCLTWSMFSNCRMSHIDQNNLHIEKEKSKQWVDVYFEKVTNYDIDESEYKTTEAKIRKISICLPVPANETNL